MKRLSIFLGTAFLSFCITMSAQAYKVSFDENPSTSYGSPITEEYASLGIHFKSGAATPQGLGGISLYGGTVFTATSWDGSVFPVLLPTSQYLGLDKPQGETVVTGIAIKFDNFSTQLGFEYRRPGNNRSTYSTVNIYLYNTALGMGNPVYSDQITAYTDPSQWGISDSDAWLPYSKDKLPEFDLAVLYSDKKFAIDNLSYGEDKDGDGVTDDADNCPNTPAGEQVDANGCSASQLADSDWDGVPNDKDLCPNTPAGETVDVNNGCSVSQLTDTDGDGVMDAYDRCPNTPAGEIANVEGCSISQLDPTCLSTKVTVARNLWNTSVACALKEIKDSKDKFDLGNCLTKAVATFESNWQKAENKKVKKALPVCYTEDKGNIEDLILYYNSTDDKYEGNLDNIYKKIVPSDTRPTDPNTNKMACDLLTAANKRCLSLLAAESNYIKDSSKNKTKASYKKNAVKTKADIAYDKAWQKAVDWANFVNKKTQQPRVPSVDVPTDTARYDIKIIIDQLVEDISDM